MLDVRFLHNRVTHRYDQTQSLTNPVDDFPMYEPTGELQGIIKVPAKALTLTSLTQIFYGMTERLTVGIVIPYIYRRSIILNLGWESGDYAAGLGRRYSGEDFWEWAESMGQPKPEDPEGYEDGLGDVIIGAKYLISRGKSRSYGLLAFASTWTGKDHSPEILGAIGTTGYENGTNGDIGLHITFDHYIPGFLRDRLILGGELFYEYFFWRTFISPRGEQHPLLLTQAPYVGETYRVKPGDYCGGIIGLEIVPYIGPKSQTWMTRDNPEMVKALPKVFTITVSLRHSRFWGSEFKSDSEFWDIEQMKLNKGGFRFKVSLRSTLSLFRFGLPLNLYSEYSNQEILPGKNFLPIVGYSLGVQALGKF